MPVAIEPTVSAFRELWPAARVTNLLDDALAPDLAAAGSITPAMNERFITIARYCESCGADAVLFTCSAFGTAIEAARAAVKVPVLKPNEAMIEEALAAGSNVAVLTTFEPSIPSLKRELEALASSRGMQLKLRTRAIPTAEMGLCDALVLGQFSMARAAPGIPARPGRKVLTSPHSAVTRLKQLFAAR